jgi:hypothetical protein
MMGHLLQDLSYGLRTLLRHRLYTAVAVLTLALGIGANTAVFGVVHGVLLRPLAFPQPERMVWLWDSQPGAAMGPVALPEFLDWRAQSHSFEHLAAISGRDYTLGGREQTERIGASSASADLFPLLGVQAALGRTFLPEENRAGQGRVVVLTDGFWRRALGAEPRVLGRPLLLDGQSYTTWEWRRPPG